MNPDAWDCATDDRQLIAMLGWDERGVARKRRLYLIGLCRYFWKHLQHETGRAAIRAVESFLEGDLSRAGLQAAHEAHSQTYVAYITEHGKRVARTRQCRSPAAPWRHRILPDAG